MSNFVKNHNTNLSRDLFALSLERTDKIPLQVQLLEALRDIIMSSPDNAGAQLPASRLLATELSVSRTTVQAVYDQLISEGYLIARRGSGTYVAENISHLAPPRPLREPEAQTIKPWAPFQVGLPDLSLLPHARWARHLDRVWRAPGPELLGRADPLGWYPLRATIVDHLASWRNLVCEPEQVVITSGARESFELIFRGCVGADVKVAIEDPCWHKTRGVLETAGVRACSLPIDQDGFDASRIPPEVTVAIVTPSRHYPTGLSLPLPRRISLMNWAEKTDGLIVEDDYDSEFRYHGHPLPSLAGLDGLHHTIYMGSFSKLISPALRIGYLVVPKRLLDAVRAYMNESGPHASLVPQPALAAFMQSGEFALHLRRMRRVYARRQAHLISMLKPVQDLLDVRLDPAGMHLCLPLKSKLSDRISDREICAIAQKAGLSVDALSSFCVLDKKPQALLVGYAAFDEDALSSAASKLISILRTLGKTGF